MGSRIGRARGLTVVLVLMGLVLMMLAASGAGAATVWTPDLSSTPYKGQYGIDPTGRYYWTDVSQGMDSVYLPDFALSITYGIHNSDHDPATGTYPYPYCAYPAQPLSEGACPFRVGVYAERSFDDGATWAETKRLNPETVQGERSTIAAPPGPSANDNCSVPPAAGNCWVYVAWVSQSSYYNHTVGASPRVLYFTSNNFWGDPGSWPTSGGDPVNLQMTAADGRVDFPSLAAALNGIVYLSWTNSDNGKIMLAISEDHGVTWTTKVVGKTSRVVRGWIYGNEGRGGRPAVATSDDGSLVSIAWIASKKGDLHAVTSTDGGTTFGDEVVLAKSGTTRNGGAPQGAGAPGRLAFVWTTPKGAFVREFDAPGTWAPRHTVARTSSATPPSYTEFESAAIGLDGASTIGVAYGGCFVSWCPHYARSRGTDLVWTESTDNGVTWKAPQVIMDSQNESTGGGNLQGYMNNLATIIYSKNGAGVPITYVRWNSFEPSAFFYQLLDRTKTET